MSHNVSMALTVKWLYRGAWRVAERLLATRDSHKLWSWPLLLVPRAPNPAARCHYIELATYCPIITRIAHVPNFPVPRIFLQEEPVRWLIRQRACLWVHVCRFDPQARQNPLFLRGKMWNRQKWQREWWRRRRRGEIVPSSAFDFCKLPWIWHIDVKQTNTGNQPTDRSKGVSQNSTFSTPGVIQSTLILEATPQTWDFQIANLISISYCC